MGKKFALLGCLAIAIQLPVSQATAHTRSITNGKFTYVGTGTQTNSDGTVVGVSSYELRLQSVNATSCY